MKILLTIILFLGIQLPMFAGGGWPQPKGKGFFKVSQFWIIANKHFTGTGEIDPNGTRGSFFTNAYGEYGFTDRLTGVAYWPFYARAVVYEQRQFV